MSFVYPQFLFALLAISIPIIIHLFNFRRFKKIYFSDIRFLKEVKLQTRNLNRIKHLLILLARILAVSFLVFAFAQPFIPTTHKNTTVGIQAISVYVDNSFSMENVSKNGRLLDEAKKMAREIALAHSQSDVFQLLTNDFEGKHQRLVSREEFLSLLDEIKVSPAVRTISEVIIRQTDVLGKFAQSSDAGKGVKNKKSFILSDFQKSISDFEKVKNDTAVNVILLPVPANRQNNLYIDSCWFDSPVHQLNQAEKLNVRVKNLSDNTLENIPLKLFLNNQQKTPSSFSIQPNESKDIQLALTLKEAGIQQGRLELTDYPVTYDDKFYFSFNVARRIAITCITRASLPSLGEVRTGLFRSELQGWKPIQSLFGKDSLFLLTMQDENKIDYSSLASQHVIVLSELKSISSGLAQELNRFVLNGGSLIVFPSAETDTASYKIFLSALGANFYLKQDTSTTKIDRVNFESEIFSDVFEKQDRSGAKEDNLDLPVVHAHFIQSRFTHTNEEMLLKLKNGDLFFSKYSYKKGKVYLSAVPLNPDWSNLAKHALFVPLMYKIAMNSAPSTKLFYILGRDNSIDVTTRLLDGQAKLTGENVYKIKGENNFEIIPESQTLDLQPTIFMHNQVKDAGNYQLCTGTEIISGLSFNYDRKESDLNKYTQDELITICEKAGLINFSLIDTGNKDIAKVLADISQGKKLWKWCIVFVLLFLAAEVLLLRFWK